MFNPPRLSRARVALALSVAMIADGLQILAAPTGPIGWVFFSEAIDVVAMAVTTWLLGFHLLLLPTFVVEFLPVVDMLPTWTGCVAAVIALRKREKSISVTTSPVVEPDQIPPQIGAGESNQSTPHK